MPARSSTRFLLARCLIVVVSQCILATAATLLAGGHPRAALTAGLPAAILSTAPLVWFLVARPLRLSMAATHEEADRSLQETARRKAWYETMFERSPSGILVMDEHGTILDANPAFCACLGYESAELRGRDVHMLASQEEKELVDAHLQKILKEGRHDGTSRSLRKDGAIRSMKLRETRVTLPDGRDGILTLVEDVTEAELAGEALQRSAALYRSLFRVAPCGILLEDESGTILDANPSLCRSLGYAPDGLIGRKVHDLAHPDLAGRVDTHIARVLQGENLSHTIKSSRADGSSCDLILTETRIPLPAGGLGIIVASLDITHQVRIEERLKASEAKLRYIIENTSDAIYLKDEDGRYQLINLPGASLCGLAVEEVLGKTDHELFDEEEARSIVRLDMEVRASGRAVSFEGSRIIDGIERTFATHKFPYIPDPETGRILGVIGVTQDITDRKRTERELRQARAELERRVAERTAELVHVNHALGASERRFRKMLEDIQLIALLVDADGRIVFCNEFLLQLTGYDRDQVMGRDVFELLMAEGQRELIATAFRSRIHEGTIRVHDETEVRTRGGDILVIQWNHTVLRDTDDRVTGLASIGSDVTARKRAETELLRSKAELEERVRNRTQDLSQAVENLRCEARERERVEEELREEEEKYRGIFESSGEGIVVLEASDGIILANPAAEAIFGVPVGSLAGHCMKEFLQESDRNPLAGRAAGTPPGGRVRLETTIRRPSGEVRELLLTATPVADGEGHYEGASAILRDITELRRAQRETERARDVAEAATRAKSQFLANMSHEIRTPMNGVLGMTQLLLETPLSTEQRDFAESIRRSGQSLLTIINDILDVSKIEAGKMELEREEFSVREVIQDAVGVVAARAQAKGVELIAVVEAAVPTRLRGDAGRLGQVLVNLLSNAVKFTGIGEVVLRAGVRGVQGSAVRLHFSVRDTGIGIPQERLESLFNPFTQVDPSTTRRFGGTGLGLTICRQLVEMMGGSIRVRSQEGRGATFEFDVQLEASGDPRTAETPRRMRSIYGLRALVVSPNRALGASLAEQLGFHGCGATCVSDLVRASAEIDDMPVPGAQTYCHVFVDATLPLDSIVGWLRETRSRPNPDVASIPIAILVTIGTRADVLSACQGLKVQCVNKPANEASLVQLVASAAESTHRLPLRQTPAPMSPALFEPPQFIASVLLVEDNDTNQKVAVHLLKKAGYECTVATNGLAALRLLEEDPLRFDVVLMDCQMPVMDGYQAAVEIRASERSRRRVPIIAMTAHAMPGDRERCLASGMDDYLSKPIQREELLTVLERFVAGTPPR